LRDRRRNGKENMGGMKDRKWKEEGKRKEEEEEEQTERGKYVYI
jgi:hypothetical protein